MRRDPAEAIDKHTAYQWLACAERVRGLTAEYAAKVAAELSAHNLWAPPFTLAHAAPAFDPTPDVTNAERLRENLDDLVDGVIDQAKLEYAGERA